MDDLVIRGGMILDGTGVAPVPGDLAVRDGRIASITPRHSGPVRRVIDATAHVVAPGFIDIKTHSDFTLPDAPRAESKVLQGVTTDVVGHCGFSLAPVTPGRARLLQEYLAGFAPWIETRETTFAEYMDAFPPTAINTIMQVQADITTFDPAAIIDRATYEDPHRYADGIGSVVVNGTVVVDSGEHTGALPGRVLRRGPAGIS